MSKKKAGGAGKKKKKVEEEDLSTEQLPKLYRRKCEALAITPYKVFREKIEEALDDQDHLKKVSTAGSKKRDYPSNMTFILTLFIF